MPYTYKYIPARDAIDWTANEEYDNLLQEDLNQMFYESDNVLTISEETALASGVYQNVDVRAVSVVDLQTGERQSDDFRTLLFKDLNHDVSIGKYYQFLSNYWISINTEKVNKPNAKTTVRRCNNTLRWIDSLGGYHSVPCSIGYLIKENRDYSTAGSNVVVPSGMIDVLVQDNAETKTLKPNQRFLFGNPSNWHSYRIEGGGVGNFNNQETTNNNSGGLLRLNMAVDYTNYDNDDLTNGVADGNQYQYTLTLNESAISGDAGQTVQLQSLVTVNSEVVSRTVTWASSDTDIATVNSSGLVTFIAEGTAMITCSLANRTSVNDTCAVTVTDGVPVDLYQVRVSPTTNYILENETQIYTVYLYKNNVQQADAFVFALDANTVPSDHYTYVAINGNSFGISNLEMFLTDTLDVTATSGVYSKVMSITLKGAW
jgi:hypothetical protein